MLLFIFGGHPNWYYEDGLFVVLARNFEEATELCRQYIKEQDTLVDKDIPLWDTWERMIFLRKDEVNKQTQSGHDTWVLQDTMTVIVDRGPCVLAYAYHSG